MVYRRKWIHKKMFSRVGFGARFYYDNRGTWVGPFVKLGRKHMAGGSDGTWNVTTGAPDSYLATHFLDNYGTRVAMMPKAFEPYESTSTAEEPV